MKENGSTMRKILLFQYRDICYSSFLYFTDCLKKAFEQLGFEVEVCCFTMKTLDTLEQYVGQKFDMVIDFNSILPGAVLDSGEHLLDKINGPFYNYLLDHPLYHHEYLKEQLQDYRVICIDRGHAAYVEQYYPQIHNVLFLPLGGMCENEDMCADQEYDISLSGTYTSPRKITTIIKELSTDMSKSIFSLIDIIQADRTCTCEDGMKQLLGNKLAAFSKQDFAEAMNLHFLADMYIRAYYRHQVIEKVVSSGIKLHVLGHGYEEYDGKKGENLIVHKSVPFSETFGFIRKSKISLNVMPWFKDGAHDRIFSAMLNHSAALTDSSIYLKQSFTHREDILFYELQDLSLLPYIINDTLSSKETLEAIRTNAHQKAIQNHTWKSRCMELISNHL